MTFKSAAKRPFCIVIVLISVVSTALRAQTPGEVSTCPLCVSVSTLSLCDQTADCSPDSTAVSSQQSSGQSAASGGASYKNDWVHSWFRKVDEARESQPHYVSPIVTTHVLLVQQFRYDMSWQRIEAYIGARWFL